MVRPERSVSENAGTAPRSGGGGLHAAARNIDATTASETTRRFGPGVRGADRLDEGAGTVLGPGPVGGRHRGQNVALSKAMMVRTVGR
jgi:hypothetical protein